MGRATRSYDAGCPSSHIGTVLDPFMGAGSTLIAAEQCERRAVGIEIEPRFCDVIVERWENLTGQKAERRNVKC